MNKMPFVPPAGPTGPMTKAQLLALSAPALAARRTAAIESLSKAVKTGVLTAASAGHTGYSCPLRIPQQSSSPLVLDDSTVESVCDAVRAVYTDSTVTSSKAGGATGSAAPPLYTVTVSWV